MTKKILKFVIWDTKLTLNQNSNIVKKNKKKNKHLHTLKSTNLIQYILHLKYNELQFVCKRLKKKLILLSQYYLTAKQIKTNTNKFIFSATF